MALLPRRSCRPGIMVDLFLVFVVLFLIMTFTQRNSNFLRTDRSEGEILSRDVIECLPSGSIRKTRSEDGEQNNSEEDNDHRSSNGNRTRKFDPRLKSIYIDQRLKVIKDSRSKECRRLNYDSQEKVTLILHFNDYQLNDLKNTIGSIVLNTDMNLVEEIIVVDDASSLDHIVKDAIQYFKRIPKVRYLRHKGSEQAGTARVRSMAAKEAKTNFLVFLDSWAICNKGWLEPLIDILAEDSNAIASPHFDKIHDPVSLDYVVENENQISTISWNLAIRVRPTSTVKITNRYYHSPAIRGNVFAIRREFFSSIGAYDTELDGDGGGEHAELSLRAWLCTGSVKVAYCSRVGLLNLFDPVKVTSQNNVRRIAETWFGQRKSTVYRSFGMKPSERFVVGSDRKRSIPLIDQCKDIDWFLSNIATNMIAPSGDAVRFGILRVRTDRCGRLLPAFDRVKLDDCKQEHFTRHRPEMLFELTSDGYVKVMGKCLTTKDNAYILTEKCRQGDTKQQWKYQNEELVNVWCNFCAMHVTDPDPKMEGDRQIMMAQECGSDTSNGALFKRWEFLLP